MDLKSVALNARVAITQFKRKLKLWAGKMALWLRALMALPEDLDSIHNKHVTAHSHPSSRGSAALSSALQTPAAHMVHKHVCRQNSHTDKINLKEKSKKLQINV